METVGGADQLGGDADAVAGPAHRALQYVRDAEFGSDLRDRNIAVLVCER